jgi:hypothetical protein
MDQIIKLSKLFLKKTVVFQLFYSTQICGARKFTSLNFWSVRKIAKTDYYLNHGSLPVCLYVRPSVRMEALQLPLDGFS